MTGSKEFLTCKQASEIIGVSRSTIQRYCNEGKIALHRTPGGHRRIDVAELVNFLGNSSNENPIKTQNEHLEKQLIQFKSRLLENKNVSIESLSQFSSSNGLGSAKIFDDLIEPVLWELEEQLEAGQMAKSHVDTICLKIKAMLMHHAKSRLQFGRDLPVAIGFSNQSDHFELESAMVASTLESSGFLAYDLGRLPECELVSEVLESTKVDLVWTTFGSDPGRKKTLDSNNQLFQLLKNRTRLLIFGCALTHQARRSLGFDFIADSFFHIHQFSKRNWSTDSKLICR